MDENKTFFSTFDRVNNDGFLLVTYAGSHKGAKTFFESYLNFHHSTVLQNHNFQATLPADLFGVMGHFT